ncbi:MAG: TVP38/TMEM64 family inner membrane protein YdjZ [Pelotomaculum sp. PtaU1.Bin065]|nr:MAG: TVP38/TMEM64 family inner membrane protein YdjZ [Pelotomaculum sp. PtaU1.Bin065]
MLSKVNVQVAKDYILSFGIWAPIISFANAGLFGWVKGAVLSWSSAMAGAVLCYAIARVYGRSVVEKLTTRSALREVDVFFERYGKWAVLIARLLPFVSFDVVSYAAGLTSMGFWEFFWATGLGQLPATIVYSYVGDILAGSVRTVVFGLLLLFALSAFALMFKQIWQDRHKIKNQSKDAP